MIPMIICLLVGMVLGKRFKVPVLFPTIALVAVFSIAGGIARADEFWPVALMVVAVTGSLQIGYFLELSIRFLLVGVRASPSHANSPIGSTPTRRPAH
jgi:hypothetical protein